MSDFLFLDAIAKQPVARTPLWIMRQAGRYLSEYRALRERYSFLEVCKTPELATEVTLQPLRRFGFDAAILFSDILVIPEAMGQHLAFLEDHGPQLSPRIASSADLDRLTLSDIEGRLAYVASAIRHIRAELPPGVPLIGFSGSPFTLATYMVEGKPSKSFKHIKGMAYANPHVLERLLKDLTEAVIRYLRLQVEAGAQALQVFDTWGGLLPPHHFERFSGQYLRAIVEALAPTKVPVTLFSRGGIGVLRLLADSGAAMLGVDWTTDLKEAKELLGDRFALQGNMDPTALYGSREGIASEVKRILSVFQGQSGHVFNLGHGILPDIPVDNVAFLVDTVREESARMHQEARS
jgi:uroporphyrinogen decarboxylase